MTPEQIKTLISMIVYMLAVVGIGLYFAKRAKQSSGNYFLGGRSLGPWMAAMSAEASDMSGWLLMGLPGVAYWCGLADAAWTAIGLAIGTYVNWLIVAKRLRNYSVVSGNSITIPEFFSNRFNEKKKVILSISAIFILIFFTVYAASCFVTCGKLFSALFGFDYHVMMIIGATFVVFYTFIGGFLAESASDFMQAIVMVGALIVVLIVGVANAGGLGAVIENAQSIDGYLMLFGTANPICYQELTDEVLAKAPTLIEEGIYLLDGQYYTNIDALIGQQLATDGVPMFNAGSSYSAIGILSALAWGLGYFGMPQVLLRFMAIRRADELKRSRRIATVWVVISLAVAVFIGIVGRAVYPSSPDLNTSSTAENVFIELSQNLLPPLIAGVVMAGILAATISSSDSYLLIAASAVSKNLYQGVIKKDASDKQVMWTSRLVLIVISVIGVIIAWDENSVIFKVVSFAWAGFGATFGPLMIFSLFWKRVNQKGAIAGMLVGGIMVFVWKLLLSPIGGFFAVYELLPAFILSSIAIVVVSLLTKEPDKDITDAFDKVRDMSKKGFIEQDLA